MNRQTLRFHSQRPLHVRRNMSRVPCADVAARVRKHVEQDYKYDKPRTETEAIRFYLLNHAMADLRQKYGLDDPLPPEAVELAEAYHQELNSLAVRMFSYLILITTRESRHGSMPSTLLAKIEEQFGAGAKAFQVKIKGFGEHSAVEAWMKNPPEDCTLGEYVDMMSFLFYAEESGYSGGYGGPKWGVIADLVREYVHGRINAEMMLDTAFTLAHNGGPIFNKGMCFGGYQMESLMKVLDIQASGQIPLLVGEANTYNLGNYVPNEIVKLYGLANKVLGGAYEKPLDWWLVEVDAKGTHAYSIESMKNMQKNLHGLSPVAGEIEKLKAEKEAAEAALVEAKLAIAKQKAAEAAAKQKAVEAAAKAKQYAFGPGTMFVEKIERDAA